MRSVMFESILPLAARAGCLGVRAGRGGAGKAERAELCVLRPLRSGAWPAALEGMAANDISALLDTIGGYRFAANTLLAGTAVCGFLAWGRRQLRKGGRR